MATLKTDVLIVGGGLAGLTLAGVLGKAGVNVTIIDREAPEKQLGKNHDGRTTAISFASHRVLQAAGVWADIKKDCAPIRDIRVADGASPLFLHFSADKDGNKQPFGWIIENSILRRALVKNLERLKKTVRYLTPAEIKKFQKSASAAGVLLRDGTNISAALLVGADGRHSATRKWLEIDVKERDYAQTAVVCNVAHEKDHLGSAVEHFLPAGPFAILPMTKERGKHRSSIVWTVEKKDAPKILSLPPKKIDAELQKLFGEHLGRVRHVSKPMSYPLSLLHANRYTGNRAVLLAEAAHVVHPIAGQGLNLSMRDIALLAEIIVDALRTGTDIGSPTRLKEYARLRRADTLLMAGFTDALNRLFSNQYKSVAALRNMGLGGVEKSNVLRKFFARQAMGLGGKPAKILRQGRL